LAVGVLLIGAGRWARNIARALSRIPDAELLCIADVRREAADELSSLYAAKPYYSHLEAIRGCGADAAVIAVTPSQLARVARDALNAGLHVFVEKPVAYTSREAEELARLAESRGLVAVPGFIMRFNPVVQWLKRSIAWSGVVEAYFYRLSQRPDHLKSTPIALDLAIHDIDMALWMLGGVEEASMTRVKTSIDEAVHITLRSGERTALIHVSGLSPVKYRRITVVTMDELVEADTDKLEVILHRHWAPPRRISLNGKEPLLAELEAFIARVEGKGHESLWAQPSLWDAVRALRVLEEAGHAEEAALHSGRYAGRPG